ncbi:hypothetical protein [Rhodovulum sp. PH10]|uniref:hypothetical protein n=1 Tax=Rhodovulum sp. PH10 TaxID=1187851 RepID=UPI00068940B8|nr:hypothetical protein [Rhodovulum sp. PH10]
MAKDRFHRLQNPWTQTDQDAVRQVETGEIWGRPARGSDIPSVKAYRGPMPDGRRGIEFTTPVAPQPGSGSLYEARWYYPLTPGVLLKRNLENEEFAVIPAVVKNFQP